MKRIFKLKHWDGISTKEIKNLKNKTKTIGIIGASRKLGVTHVSICLANFLHSALKEKVLYIELGNESSLFGFVGQTRVQIEDSVGFMYKGVIYVLACEIKEAVKLIDSYKGYIVIDVTNISEETKVILNRCEKLNVIGSMKPWCKADVYNLFNLMKGGGIKNTLFLNKSQEKNEITEFIRAFKIPGVALPIIDNPFSIKEKDFASLIKMIM